MSTGEDKSSGLVPAQSTALSKAGAKSLAARGRNELRIKEEAEEWLRKGLELQEAAPADLHKSKAPANPYADQPTGLRQLETAAAYIEQILAGTPPEMAAKNLSLTPEDQEMAHVAHFFLPDTLAKIARDEKERKQLLLRKREEILREAFQCFELGYELDPSNPELLYQLADSCYQGDGVQKNLEMAVELYRRAARMGHARAQTAVGDAYAHCGSSCLPKDEAQAAIWYQAAADQGNEEALCMIVDYYQRGIGVRQNHAEAARLLRKGVERGDETAEHNLRLYAKLYGAPYNDGEQV
jgi:TPR repeat protein